MNVVSMKALNYINGEWVGEEHDRLEVFNPASGEIVGTCPKVGRVETQLAVDSAYTAFSEWSSLSVYERVSYLKKWHQLILQNKEELATIITLEMGKTLKEARGEVDYAASYIEWFAEEGKRIYGEIIPSHNKEKRMQVWKKPVGVVAAITPWNFPAAMLTRKMGPALAAGCTIVVKPSSDTPLTAIKLIEYCHEAGFPKGVVNIVTGSSAIIGDELTKNEKVRKITFTGSTEVGKKLMEQAAHQMKRLSLELGGHAPIIVLDDANIDKAVQATMASKFRNAGQTCICGNRIYVQSGIYDEFVERFSKEVQKLKVGNGLDATTDIGPLINSAAVQKVNEHVEDAVSKGASIVTGGVYAYGKEDNFYLPTVLSNVKSDMLVMREETFGPVAPIQKITSDQEAIELANSSPYGLAAYVFTESMSRGTKIIEKLDFGIVGWNDGAPSAAQAPFGG